MEIRPISVIENLNWNSMSNISKLLWMVKTVIQMLSLTVFSLRVDRIFDRNYLSNHWKHYSGKNYLSIKSIELIHVVNVSLKVSLNDDHQMLKYQLYKICQFTFSYF